MRFGANRVAQLDCPDEGPIARDEDVGCDRVEGCAKSVDRDVVDAVRAKIGGRSDENICVFGACA